MATNYTDTSVNELIISKISQEQYLELSSQGMLNENELYIVENEILDAMGHVVINVADPIELSDAANKHYVDLVCSVLSGEIEGLSNSLSDYVPLSGNTLVSNILSIETDLYIRDTSISDLISEGSSRVILREWD